MLLLCAAGGELILRFAGGRRSPGGAARLRRAWAISAVALFVAYGCQELAEGWLAAGHPAGVAGVFGAGGWTAAPLAALIGLLVAALCRGARAALAARAGAAAMPAPRVERLLVRWRPPAVVLGRSGIPRLGGRGPPAIAG